MSEYYDHYHRWEPLAEFHFNLDSDDEDYDDENYLYCLCSRAFIRDGVKFYYVDKEGSESEAEAVKNSQSQPGDDHSHVHFSLDTSYKEKCEKDEGASCYCSASHTDNCCSTDEHDAQIHGTSHALQPSDSGADLTYQDGHSEYTNHDKQEHMDQDTTENYLSESTWDKYWAVNGERLIWASWIKKYSDYINPTYLNENNDLLLDDNRLPKQRSVDQIFSESDKADDEIRERKFSYDSKVNPYKKGQNEKVDKHENKDETWLPVSRRRSCSEHERIVSPRTLAGTDSMTNVTKMTMSSYDVSSSHVTSESTPTDDFSVSSSTSDDQSNDQTRIANVEHDSDNIEEMDTDQYWQFLWKKHFGEQFALHYANYIEMYNKQYVPSINVENITEDVKHVQEVEKTPDIERVLDIDCENSEGNSQELPTVIEIQSVVTQVKQIAIDNTPGKQRKKGKKDTNKYLGSVGVLLQSLLKDEQAKSEDGANKSEVMDAGDENNDKKGEVPSIQTANNSVNVEPVRNNFTSYNYDDGEDDAPEESPISLKRSHELDFDENVAEKIKSTFEMMGYAVDNNTIPKGNMVYRKRAGRLHPPRYKKLGAPKKTYFDDDGNPIQNKEKGSQDECEMQTEDECPDFRTQAIKLLNVLSQNSENVKKSDENTEKSLNDFTPSSTNKIRDNTDKIKVLQNKSNSAENESESYDVLNKVDSMEGDDKTSSDSLPSSDDQNKASSNESMKDLQNCDSTETASNSMPYNVHNHSIENDDKSLAEASEVPLPSDAESNSDKGIEVKMEITETVGPNTESAKRRRRQKRQAKIQEEIIASMPDELKDDPRMMKYWKKRHSLFHRFDEGIRLDRESWFSVTPESVARHIADKYAYDTVLDGFCGAGGNAIQFAFTTKKVIAIDIDPVKIELAKHNAEVYGVADRIQFIVGDFFRLAGTVEADMVFLSPPWGGPDYTHSAQYDIETMLQPRPASELMAVARTVSPTVYLYLPRNSRPDQILSLAKEVGGSVEIEQSFLDRRFVAITAYFY